MLSPKWVTSITCLQMFSSLVLSKAGHRKGLLMPSELLVGVGDMPGVHSNLFSVRSCVSHACQISCS